MPYGSTSRRKFYYYGQHEIHRALVEIYQLVAFRNLASQVKVREMGLQAGPMGAHQGFTFIETKMVALHIF